jgi:hypothetical protein
MAPSTSSTTLRASVTAYAAGSNLCSNPDVDDDTSMWAATGAATLVPVTATDLAAATAPNPLGTGGGGGLVTFTAASDSLLVPNYNIVQGDVYTASLWVFVPDGSGGKVRLDAEGVQGQDSGGTGFWVRLAVTFTAASTAPTIALVPSEAPFDGPVYFVGGMIQPGAVLNAYTNGGAAPASPLQVLIDGSDTPITANGLDGYVPTPGDRLLVQQVGKHVEVLQFISRGTVPYLQEADLGDLSAQVSNNSDALAANSGQIASVDSDLQDYKGTTDSTLATFQPGFDVLTGLGQAGVQEDYIWVGDDPAMSTVKAVQVSPYFQGGMSAGDSATVGAYFGLVDTADAGDITYTDGSNPPMTTFYGYFTANGLLALAWNA